MSDSKDKSSKKSGEGPQKTTTTVSQPKTDTDRFVLTTVYPEASQIFTAVLEPLAAIQASAVVVLDTNVLLVPFAVSPQGLDEIGATYRKLAQEKRLVVPGQVAREFARHRANRLAELYQQLYDRKSRLISSGIGNHPLLARLSEYPHLLQKEQAMLAAAKEYGEQLANIAEQIRTWTWSDPVSELYRSVFAGDVVVDPAIDREKLEADLAYRVAHSIPPGYKDAAKPDGGIGDVLIWNTILHLGDEREQHVIFVSGEEKSDWWHRSGARQLYPRFELVDEFRRHSGGKSFHIASLADLLALYGAADELVSEVRETEQEGGRTPEEEITARVDPELKLVLDTLPHMEKMVFLLVELEGFSYKQVAEVLDVPVGTVGWRLHEARKRLYRLLAERHAQTGDVTFPAEQRLNIVHGSVDFPAEAGSGRILCRVSEEALSDFFGATTADTMVPTFLTHRSRFEEVARRKMMAGDYVDGVVSISTRDFRTVA